MDEQRSDIPFNNKWCLWYHYDTSSWSKNSFKSLMTISTVGELWTMVDSLLSTDNIMLEHMYIMRDGIMPIWEDPKNRDGGCWSIKVDLKDSLNTFIKILAIVLGENSLIAENGENLSKHITGVSFCSKNVYSVIIQCWCDDKQLNKVSLLNPKISENYVAEIIFRSHVPEY